MTAYNYDRYGYGPYSYGLYSYGLHSYGPAYVVMAYVVMAYIAMAYILIAFIVMDYIVMALQTVLRARMSCMVQPLTCYMGQTTRYDAPSLLPPPSLPGRAKRPSSVLMKKASVLSWMFSAAGTVVKASRAFGFPWEATIGA